MLDDDPANTLCGGVNLGYAWTDVTGRYYNFVGPTECFDTSPDTGALGAHIGLQHQFGQFVLGIEGAYSTTHVFDNWTGGTLGPSASCLAVNPTPTTCEARVDHVWTVGPRLGFTPHDRSLFYVTGGIAWGEVDTRLLDRSTVPVSVFDRTSADHTGWFIGGGYEYAVTKNLILGVEYQQSILAQKIISLRQTRSARRVSMPGVWKPSSILFERD